MKHIAGVMVAFAALLSACGTPAKDPRGSSSGVGTEENDVDRQYGRPAHKVWDAAVAAVKSSDLRVESDRHDELGGELVARRADGHRVTARVTSIDKTNAKVSIRVAPGDPTLAGLLHERIADKLGMGEAKAAFLGGNTVEGQYGLDFAAALAAAERSCKSLNYVVIHQEHHDTWAQLDARTRDSTPVRFRMDRRGEASDPTKVTFIAGRGKTDISKTLISQMKAEFDRQATLPAK